jgi:hypothetical protein
MASTGIFYDQGWEEAIKMVTDVINEMRQQYPFHDFDIATLNELEQRIV